MLKLGRRRVKACVCLRHNLRPSRRGGRESRTALGSLAGPKRAIFFLFRTVACCFDCLCMSREQGWIVHTAGGTEPTIFRRLLLHPFLNAFVL
jgi:hypothetical protein